MSFEDYGRRNGTRKRKRKKIREGNKNVFHIHQDLLVQKETVSIFHRLPYSSNNQMSTQQMSDGKKALILNPRMSWALKNC